jgi:hypothetical protein
MSSQRAEVALADHGAAKVHEGFVELGPSFPAQPQAAEEVKPGERALDTQRSLPIPDPCSVPRRAAPTASSAAA